VARKSLPATITYDGLAESRSKIRQLAPGPEVSGSDAAGRTALVSPRLGTTTSRIPPDSRRARSKWLEWNSGSGLSITRVRPTVPMNDGAVLHEPLERIAFIEGYRSPSFKTCWYVIELRHFLSPSRTRMSLIPKSYTVSSGNTMLRRLPVKVWS